MQQQVVSPHDPRIAKRNRLTLVALLAFIAMLMLLTYSQRSVLYHAMTTESGAHGKR